jgi:RNA polymerase sigma-70 factor (ECF subfamily)
MMEVRARISVAGMIAADTTGETYETALVARAQAGDTSAFDDLVRPRLARLLRLAMSIVGNDADARDAVQDSCLRAWRDVARLRAADRFEAWLWQITINACRTAVRGHRRVTVREIAIDDLPIGHDYPDRRPSLGDDVSAADAIRRAFGRLDPDKRTILVLHHVEDRSIVEIADLLRIPEGTAKWRLHAARKALERALAEEGR